MQTSFFREAAGVSRRASGGINALRSKFAEQCEFAGVPTREFDSAYGFAESFPLFAAACRNLSGAPRQLPFQGEPYFFSNSFATSFRSWRMGSYWGQTASHLPHSRQSEAFRLGAVWTAL